MFPLLLLCGLSLGSNHAQATLDAAKDVSDPRRVNPLVREEVRYFDFSDVEDADPRLLERFIQAFSGHCNGLSRNATIKIPVRVTKTLVRVYLSDYQWKRAVYETLKDADPYFHTTVFKTLNPGDRWSGGIWPPDGKYYPASDEVMLVKMKVKKVVGAVQLHTQAEVKLLAAGTIKEEQTSIGQLILLTQSQVPILDALWFFQQTAADLNRTPGYHDFLGFQDQSGFEKLLGFDEKASLKFSDLYREAVARSAVITGKRARRIEILDKPGGYLMRTLDSQVTKDRNNPLRVTDGTLKFDATEQFGPLANGMMAWGLFNSARVRQDRAPDVVAGTQNSAVNNTMIHNNIECVNCHNDGGVKDLRPYFRELFKAPKGLEAAGLENFLQQERQYIRPINDVMLDARTTYQRAVFKATGLGPKEWSSTYYSMWEWYIGARVDRKWAARSLGTTPEFIQEAFARIKKTTGQIDPVLATFLLPEGEAIAIDAWEEVYPIAQAYLRGVVP